MRRYTPQWPCVVVVVVIVGNRQRTESDERRRDSKIRLVFCLWLAARGFTLSSCQATSKVSIDILSAFRLLPRPEEVLLPWVYCYCRQPPNFARNWFTNSQNPPTPCLFGKHPPAPGKQKAQPANEGHERDAPKLPSQRACRLVNSMP